MRNRSLILLAIAQSLLTPPLQAQKASKHGVEAVVGGFLDSEGGDWNPETSPLLRPFGVDFEASGNMLIVELEGGRIHRRGKLGGLLKVAGDGSKTYTGDGGPAIAATFNGMHNVAITPNDDIYVADSWNHCIRRIHGQTGFISTFAGTGQPGFAGDDEQAANAKFDFIMCITLNHSNDILHVADLKNRRIRAINLQTGIVTTIAGNGKKGIPVDGGQATESPLVDPRAVAADSKGNVYILERSGHALRVVRSDGTIHTVAGTGQRGFTDGAARQAEFGSPKHVCVDKDDNVYIADDQNKAIRKFDPVANKVTTVLGRGFGGEKIELLNPHGVCWQDNWLYVIDTSHNRILRIQP